MATSWVSEKLVNFFAIVLSFVLIITALPYFNQLAGKNIGSTFAELPLLSESWFWLTLTAIFILGSIIAGLYPAFVLSSFRIVMVLKGKFFGSKSGIALRKTLFEQLNRFEALAAPALVNKIPIYGGQKIKP